MRSIEFNGRIAVLGEPAEDGVRDKAFMLAVRPEFKDGIVVALHTTQVMAILVECKGGREALSMHPVEGTELLPLGDSKHV